MTKRSVKTYENRGLVLSFAAASLLLGLIGCGAGGSSDPTSDYKDLQATEAPHSEKPRAQEVMDHAYTIEVAPNIEFVEGEAFSFPIRVIPGFDGVTSYDFKLIGVPPDAKSMTMTAVAGEPNMFRISWTPPKGTIPTNRQIRHISYRVELSNVKAKTPDVEKVFAMINKVQERRFSVVRTSKSPTIAMLNSVPAEVKQGTNSGEFSVDVFDPASYAGYTPRLDHYFEGANLSEGRYEANGAVYLRKVGSPKLVGDGLWRFSFVFDTKSNDVGAQLDANGNRIEGAPHLDTRFHLKAFSAAGGVSAEKIVKVKIPYMAPQGAVIAPLAAAAAAKAAAKEQARLDKEAKKAAAAEKAAAQKAEREAKAAAAKAEKEAKAAAAKLAKEEKAAAAKADKEAKAAAAAEKAANAPAAPVAEKTAKKSSKSTKTAKTSKSSKDSKTSKAATTEASTAASTPTTDSSSTAAPAAASTTAAPAAPTTTTTTDSTSTAKN